MVKTCTKTPVTERVVGGKLAEKVVRRVGNCKKGGSRLLLVAKKMTQSVVKKAVTLVHRFQKGITPETAFAIAERGIQCVVSMYSGKQGVMAIVLCTRVLRQLCHITLCTRPLRQYT